MTLFEKHQPTITRAMKPYIQEFFIQHSLWISLVSIFLMIEASHAIGQAQQSTNQILSRQLRLLRHEQPSEAYVDSDSLAEKVIETLVAHLKSRISVAASIDTLPGLQVIKSDDEIMKMYIFSYPTGGTSLDRYYNVAQWRNGRGELFAVDLSGRFEGNGNTIVQSLKSPSFKNLYLISNSRSMFPFIVEHACVFQFNDEVVAYPAFNGETCISSIDYQDFHFDPQTRILYATHDSDDLTPYRMSYKDLFLDFKYAKLAGDTSDILKLEFDGRKFMRIK